MHLMHQLWTPKYKPTANKYKSAKYTSPQVLIEDLAQLLRPIYEIPDSHSLVCALGLFQPQSEQSFGRSHTSTENRIQALKSSKRSPPEKKLPNKAGALAAISNHPQCQGATSHHQWFSDTNVQAKDGPQDPHPLYE